MKASTTIGQVRSEFGRYRNFFLKAASPLEPLNLSIHFDRAAVNIAASPYIVFQNDVAEAHIKHIKEISKRQENGICIYIFTCQDYSANGDPMIRNYRVECA